MSKRWHKRGCGLFEELEPRRLLSAAAAVWQSQLASVNARQTIMKPTFVVANRVHPAATTPPSSALTPAQVRGAYGISQIMYGSITGDGSGQTIAIIDAYNYPTAYADLLAFDAAFSLPDLQQYNPAGNTGAYFRVVAQDGSNNLPPTDPAGPTGTTGKDSWEEEEALDVQWAHAIAPGANIILVEANSASFADLVQNAVNWARNAPGVSAVSMSFSGSEFYGENAYDTYFTTQSPHTGVTFLAATGDTGKPSGYPAYSPNVVAVGGTTLTVNGNSYVSEAGWSGSGGGPSTQESQPAYQNGVVTQTSTKRANPDVSMDANPNSGVAVYDSYDYPSSPWFQVGGTSLATPMWAALVAVINQGRVINGQTPMDGATQTLPKLYQLAQSDFHDVTTGNNGYSAGVGYDYVTGRGTPTLNLVYDLAVGPSPTPGTPVLAAVSDTGVSNSDKITNLDNSSAAKELQFSVSGVTPGATVNLLYNSNVIGTAVAAGTTVTITTNGTITLAQGSDAITATQQVPGMGMSAASAALTITVDSVPPTVSSQSPSGGVSGAQSTLQLTFNSTMDPTSFSLADITSFTGPSGNLSGQLTGFAWSGSNKILTVQFASQSAVGSYNMTFGSQIADVAGNNMASGYNASFSIISAVYSAMMDLNPGWTFDAGSKWAWGVPTGGGSHNNDPTSGHTGSNVVGYNLSGDYAKNITYYATTPIINASNYQNMTLTFWRWLGVNRSATASVLASPDGGNTWVTLWTNNGSTIADTSWTQQTFSLPASFNGSSTVLIRWGMGPTGGGQTYPGWNIDDVVISGTMIPPPTVSGQVFVDANSNGTVDAGETGLQGATVYLDLNSNGHLDNGEPSATTDANGNYTLTAPGAGTYTVAEVLPSGYIGTTSLTHTLALSGQVTGQNFGDFPTTFTTTNNTAGYYVTVDASQTYLQISAGNAPLATPTYQTPVANLNSLTFNLQGAANQLTVDYTNGTPLPTNGLTLNGAPGSQTQMLVLGQNPTQSFTMTDTQIVRTSGSRFITFNNLWGLSIQNMTVHFNGTLSTISDLEILSGASFLWGS